MSTVTDPDPVQVTTSDLFGFTLFLATILHAIPIFGLGFSSPFGDELNTASMLEVTMVLTKTHQEPTEAERIASENQLASGNTDQDNQPSAPFIGPSNNQNSGIAPFQSSPGSIAPGKTSEQHEQLTVATSQSTVPVNETIEAPEQSESDKQEKISEQELDIARLVAELRQQESDYAKRPKVRYISTLSAKTATEATYVREWVEKVKRVGNLNYPDEIRNNRLSGDLILSVVLNHHGAVEKMKIESSSGSSLLDQSAKRIAKLASPYKVFPPEMRENYNQLVITRTWEFGKDNMLATHSIMDQKNESTQ